MKKNITVYFYLDFSTLAKLFFVSWKNFHKRGCNLDSKVLLFTYGQRKNVIETVCLAGEKIYTTNIVNFLAQRGIAEKIPIGTVA